MLQATKGAIFMEIQLWRSILCPYELAVKELMVKFEHIIEEHKQNDLYSPIEQVSGRVKSPAKHSGKDAAQTHSHGTHGGRTGGYRRYPHYLPV